MEQEKQQEHSSKSVTMLDSNMMYIEESSFSNPMSVLSNKILIRGGEARIFKTTSASGFGNSSEESVVETVMFDSECNSDSLVCVLIKEVKKPDEKIKGPELDDSLLKLEEDLDWDLSSEEDEIKETESAESSALPATLKLLEQVSVRILGEKTVTIPEIEKVEKETGTPLERKKSSRLLLKEEQLGENYREYLDVLAFSEKFVDSILLEAKKECKEKHDMKVAVVCFEGYKQTIVWPSIKDFDVQTGIESIDLYIQHGFSLKEAWKYKITYLIAQSDRSSDFYFFEAKFCIPTSCYPISQATVSVFFTYEVSRVIPKNFPVRVTFTLESLRTVMVPGEFEINDESLLRVLYSKLAVFKKLFF